tara:strand:- start:390 stop:557 length:168 start_codon:yes stop_codon:yes gene_type:complete
MFDDYILNAHGRIPAQRRFGVRMAARVVAIADRIKLMDGHGYVFPETETLTANRT